jgi:hypothetical protein
VATAVEVVVAWLVMEVIAVTPGVTRVVVEMAGVVPTWIVEMTTVSAVPTIPVTVAPTIIAAMTVASVVMATAMIVPTPLGRGG